MELNTKKRLTSFSEQSNPCVKKQILSQMQFTKKQTNQLFEDENHNKITFKRRDFYSAHVIRNLKTGFGSVRAIISK